MLGLFVPLIIFISYYYFLVLLKHLFIMPTKSKVYFTGLRTSGSNNLLDNMEKLIKKAGIETIPLKDQFVALKIHFGEAGNLGFIRPNYVARIVSILKQNGAKPFLTDCNTLYSGSRQNAVDHLQTASENGFNLLSAGCQAIIGDGLKGLSYREIPIQGKYCPRPKIGAAIADADVLISLTHFKGHELAGFGGCLKNLGMGCGAVPGKLEMHSASKPVIHQENCRGCQVCIKHCRQQAISLNKQKKAQINPDKCVGCGQCIALCQFQAAYLESYDDSHHLNRRIDEYALAAVYNKPHFHISFVIDVSPECDCWNHNDASIVPNIGIAASFDPVAIDKACADLVIAAPALKSDNMLSDRHQNCKAHQDKFKILHPDTDWEFGLQYAQEIGLGNMDYELITV